MKNSKTNNQEVTFSKVYKAALESKYRTVSVDDLLTVIYATSNAEIAMELMLGIYKHPELETDVISPNSGNKLTLTHYDMFERTVSYSFEENKRIHIYLEKCVIQAKITHENYLDYKQEYSSSKDLTSMYVSLPEMEKKNDSMDLYAWNKCAKWIEPVVIDEILYQLAD
jgi:hypothetical protein